MASFITRIFKKPKPKPAPAKPQASQKLAEQTKEPTPTRRRGGQVGPLGRPGAATKTRYGGGTLGISAADRSGKILKKFLGA